MQLVTAVEEYIIAALHRAVAEPCAGGGVAATIPEFPGIVGAGDDAHECTRDLYVHLESWVWRCLKRGYALPVLDGMDLSMNAPALLDTYHPGRPDRDSEPGNRFFADSEQFLAALDGWDEETEAATELEHDIAGVTHGSS